MDDEPHDDISNKCTSDEGPMETDEGPLINENSNGLSHLLTEGEFNSVDATGVDESSASNHAFLNAVELSAGSVGDYLDSNTNEFNTGSFDVGDNAVSFPTDNLTSVLSDGDSTTSDVYKNNQSEGETEKSKVECIDLDSEVSNDVSNSMTEHEQTTTDHNDQENIETAPNNLKEQSELIAIEHETTPNDLNEKSELNSEQKEQETQGESEGDTVHTKEVQELSDTKVDATLNDTKTESTTETLGGQETEVVSEDELPVVEKPSIEDAENVSDDELPGPKPADLPADTEVVSEDELPASKKDSKESKKRKLEDEASEAAGSPKTDGDPQNKKQALEKNGESKPVSTEKRLSTEEKPKKKLPDLDKYWKVVNDDPTDFTGWTYLLQYVDQESDIEAAREAYDAFLSHYPYCYGYWRKYADYEKRKGSKKNCHEVLEKGLKSIPLSVDLWIHYLNHVKTTRSDDPAFIRSQYERAIDSCGLEFRSDRLWESYIKWEAENGTPLNVTNIYDRLLATPTLGYTSHFDNFQEHIMSEAVGSVVNREELVRLRTEVRSGAPQPTLDLPPGEDEPPDHVASDEESHAIKERIIAARRKVHKTTGEEVAARWTFEEGIKRPYFHVKPLERCQLKNWKAYLEWEKQHGSFKRALVLHERCLIACALYEEFWMRLVKFLEEKVDSDPSLEAIERDVLERACTVHHPDKPELHLHWAHFEEARGNVARAAEILERIDAACPNLVQIHYRRVNVERRRGNYEKCMQLYESYINSAKSKAVSSALAIKYARFMFHVREDKPAARNILDAAIEKEPLNHRLHLQRLDLALHTPGTPYEQLDELVSSYERVEGADTEVSATLAWRRRELAEELGDARAAALAAHHQRTLQRHLRKRNRKDKHDTPQPQTNSSAPVEPKKKEPVSGGPTGGGGGAQGGYGSYEAYPPHPHQYQPPPWGYQQPPAYQPHGPWGNYPNYY